MPKIECPLCEASFPIDARLEIKPTTKLKCSLCKNVFLARQSRILDEQDNPSTTEPTPGVARANEAEDVPVIPMASTTPPEADDQIKQTSEPSSEQISASSLNRTPEASIAEAVDPVAINKKAAQTRVQLAKQKSRRRSLILISFLLVTSIGLAIFFWQAVTNPELAGTDDTATENEALLPLDEDLDSIGQRPSTDPNRDATSGLPGSKTENDTNSSEDSNPRSPDSVNDPDSSPAANLGPAWLPGQPRTTTSSSPSRDRRSSAIPEAQPDPFAGAPDNSTPWMPNSSSTWPTAKVRMEWNAIYPRLVRLIADKPTGKQEALGVIVDTRGWVVTSLRAMAGASKIEVRQIRSHNELLDKQEVLQDEARGIIEKDIELDLVVLSVNRKFVVSLDPVSFPEKDVVVGSHRLLLPFFPKTYSQVVLREQTVANRPVFADWNQQVQAQLKSAGLAEPNLQLIPYEERLPALKSDKTLTRESIVAGAPLLNPEGEIVGLTTALRIDGKPIAIPSVHLSSMLQVASGQVKPLDSLNEGLKEIGIQTVDSKSNVKDENPLKPLTIKLNQQGSDCEAFEWRPQNSSQYALLCKLLESTVELESIAALQDQPLSEQDKILDQTNYWLEKMDKGIGENFAKLKFADFNQFALTQIKRTDSFFFVVGKVAYTAFDGPKLNQKDAVTFQIPGTQEYLMVPYDSKMPKMLPDSVWLLACYPPRADPIKFNASGNQRSAFVSRLVFVNGPFQP